MNAETEPRRMSLAGRCSQGRVHVHQPQRAAGEVFVKVVRPGRRLSSA